MDSSDLIRSRSETVLGVIYAGTAFLIWGLSPAYWKNLLSVPPIEIIMHRIVWSFFFLFCTILLQRRWDDFLGVLKNGRLLLTLLATAIFIFVNWFLYIWAVNNNYLLQASLGYYINPLVNVLLGMLFLRERLRRPQILAVLTATIGVLYLTLFFGEFPWIALCLAFSFGFYGLIRKVALVGSLVGLAVETMFLSLPAIIYLLYLDFMGVGAIFRVSFKLDLLLIGCAPVTAAPLLLFALGTKRLYLSTVGLMQYIAPSGMFLLAVLFYGEPFSKAQIWTFVMIWSALIIYSIDSVLFFRRERTLLEVG